ncbi:MAG: response regulator [Pseudomonadota bacterium]|nr:response regulator [Pseudomonadota bacterium]HON37473.1 response regulator [Deltaproteobacteria bacterium]HRS55579.1 response regulator [Desulfomonilia bacterium]HPD20649.1 response regulator [Deltaproteobacteria bacterium]HPX17588.1 response regulator [Deltaproteobacteria bacterium]
MDDDRNIQRLLKEELNDDGYSLIIASNGKEALPYLEVENGKKPDLIILDLRMPKMNGFETMGHIIKSRQDIPVIIHTAYSSYRNDAMVMAADAYVEKSHDLTRLKCVIRDLLDKSCTNKEK